MIRIITLVVVLFSLPASAYVIKETKQDEDFKIYVNDGGTAKDAVKVTGSTGAVTLGTSGETTTHTINGSISTVGGSVKAAPCLVSADYTITNTDGCGSVFVTTADTSRTVTLPTASQNSGRSISIFKADSAGIGNVTISGAVESLILIAANESMTVTSDGTSWYLKDAKYTSGAYVPRDVSAFTTGDVNTGTENITLTAHGLQTGFTVTVSSSGTLPAPLAPATSYYVIITTKNTFQLATSRANAFAGTAINLTTQGTGSHTLITSESANVSTWSFGDFAYARNGNLVTVTGYINIDPAVANTDTQLTFVLPTFRAETANYGTGNGISYAAATSHDVMYRLLIIDSGHSAGLRAFPSNVSNVTVAINFSYPIL